MLKPIRRTRTSKTTARFAIVASEYNSRFVNAMLRKARQVLRQAGARDVQVLRVPGAFEIPAVAARLLQAPGEKPAAVICLGVILQGETSHARMIAESVSFALAQLQVIHAIPVIHGVLWFDNARQAQVRCLGRTHNRGAEAATTALAMARVMIRMQGLPNHGRS